MLDIHMYNIVVREDIEDIFVDWENVYIPKHTIDHWKIITFVENSGGITTVRQEVQELIKVYWKNELNKWPNLEDKEYVIDKLARGKVPNFIQDEFDKFHILTLHDVSHILIMEHNEELRINLNLYARLDRATGMYKMVVEDDDQQAIRQKLNDYAKKWTPERIMDNHRFILGTALEEDGVSMITDDRVYFYYGMAITSEGLYKLSIPMIDVYPDRIRFTTYVLANHKPIMAYGASLMDGLWLQSVDEAKVMHEVCPVHFDRFFNHCTGKKRDWVLDMFYKIEQMEEDIFVIRNRYRPDIFGDMLLFRLYKDRIDILAGSFFHNLVELQKDPAVDRYKLIQHLTQ